MMRRKADTTGAESASARRDVRRARRNRRLLTPVFGACSPPRLAPGPHHGLDRPGPYRGSTPCGAAGRRTDQNAILRRTS